MTTDVSAERNTKLRDARGRSRCLFIQSISITGVFLLSYVFSLYAATSQDYQEAIARLDAAVNADTRQGIDVIDAIQTLIAPSQSLTAGTVAGKSSGSVDLTIHYKASTTTVAGIQFDLQVPAGLTAQAVTAGLASQASNKSVQGNPVTGGYRVIIFGLNQTTIPSGPVAIIHLQIGQVSGKLPLSLINISASSPAGSNVPLKGRNGSVTIN